MRLFTKGRSARTVKCLVIEKTARSDRFSLQKTEARTWIHTRYWWLRQVYSTHYTGICFVCFTMYRFASTLKLHYIGTITYRKAKFKLVHSSKMIYSGSLFRVWLSRLCQPFKRISFFFCKVKFFFKGTNEDWSDCCTSVILAVHIHCAWTRLPI